MNPPAPGLPHEDVVWRHADAWCVNPRFAGGAKPLGLMVRYLITPEDFLFFCLESVKWLARQLTDRPASLSSSFLSQPQLECKRHTDHRSTATGGAACVSENFRRKAIRTGHPIWPLLTGACNRALAFRLSRSEFFGVTGQLRCQVPQLQSQLAMAVRVIISGAVTKRVGWANPSLSMGAEQGLLYVQSCRSHFRGH